MTVPKIEISAGQEGSTKDRKKKSQCAFGAMAVTRTKTRGEKQRKTAQPETNVKIFNSEWLGGR